MVCTGSKNQQWLNTFSPKCYQTPPISHWLLWLIFWLTGLSSGLGQASSDADFRFSVHFDKDISVNDLTPYYLTKDGNTLSSISYQKNPEDNSFTFTGHNDFILHVSFPVIAFSRTRGDTTNHFYLISGQAVETYTGEQTLRLRFSKKYPVIRTHLDKHNEANTFEKMSRHKMRSADTDAHVLMSIYSTRWIRIQPHEH